MVGKYSEAYRPNVPSMLLELFSHQNMQDMKFGKDPKFRFDISRSIYKGFLKYIATANGYDYVVQPLPVTHFQAEFCDSQKVHLKWQPQTDKLEPTAAADEYIVYTRLDSLGFDNGRITQKPEFIVDNLQPGRQYSFKVTAVNAGGESFDSEILSVCQLENAIDTVMIVNNFDRVSSEGIVEQGDFQGFANFLDEGVPYKYDIGYTGRQHDFYKSSPWLTNDYPGWGASQGNYETQIIAGNSFDYPYIHGKAIKNNGYAYISVSDEAVETGAVDMTRYNIVDMIFGEEKSTRFSAKNDSIIFQVFSDLMMAKIENYCQSGGKLLMTGAYIGSDLFQSPKDSSKQTQFARNTLKFNFATDHAAVGGEIYTTGENREMFHYNNTFSEKCYKLEAPDAILPSSGSNAHTILRFTDNEFGAGIHYDGNDYKLVISTVPFETILTEAKRDRLMAIFLNKLNHKLMEK